MKKRITVLISFLCVSYALVGWLQSSPSSESEPAIIDLSVVPQDLEGWSGEDVAIQDETVQVLRAQSFINRIYRDASGQEISLHIANWANPVTISSAPHHPEVCYPAAGWQIVSRQTIQVGTSPENFPMELILFCKGEQRVVTGHWFRVGSVTFASSEGFQRQRYRFWGQQRWPDTTKFLIQTNAPSIDAAEDLLRQFAAMIATASATHPSRAL